MLPENLDAELVLEALAEGVRRALIEHKRAGNPVATWQDGRVVILAPEEITIPEPSARWACRSDRPS